LDARFGIVPDAQGDVAVEARGEVHALQTLTGALLRGVRGTALEKLKLEPKRTVLCVPSYFNVRQRQLLVTYAKDAGLEVLRLVTDAAAAAIAYGQGKGFARRRLLVFDLGAGGFGTAVVEMTGDDAEVVAAAGDADTGSLQLTHQLTTKVAEQLQAIHPTLLENVPDGVLDQAIDRALKTLVAEERALVRFDLGALMADGPAGTFETELERADVEKLTADVLNRAVALTLDMLKAASLEPSAVNEVLLVGGATALPWVQQRLSEIFRAPVVRVSADAVARGAALVGEGFRLSERGKPRGGLSEVLPTSLGLGVPGGGYVPVLDRFTRLPAQKTISFRGQQGEKPLFVVLQGGAPRAEDNAFLGVVQLSELARTGEVSLRFELSDSGTLKLTSSAPGMRDEERTLETDDVSGPALHLLLDRTPVLLKQEEPARPGLLRGLRSLWKRK
jgi:molecular chaperone DnaK